MVTNCEALTNTNKKNKHIMSKKKSPEELRYNKYLNRALVCPECNRRVKLMDLQNCCNVLIATLYNTDHPDHLFRSS